MKATGIVRRIDELGRISIPKEIRERIFGTKDTEGMTIELFMDDDSIVLKKYVSAEEEKEAKIRNAAIDEFAERLREIQQIATKCTCSQSDGYSQVMRICDEIAEELKGAMQ